MRLTCTAVTSAVNKSMWRLEAASDSFISSMNSSVKPEHRAPRWINMIGPTSFLLCQWITAPLCAHQTAAGKTPRRAGAPRSGTSSGPLPCRTQSAAAGRCCLWSPVNTSVDRWSKFYICTECFSFLLIRACQTVLPWGLWLWSWARLPAAEGGRSRHGRCLSCEVNGTHTRLQQSSPFFFLWLHSGSYSFIKAHQTLKAEQILVNFQKKHPVRMLVIQYSRRGRWSRLDYTKQFNI